MSGSVHFPVSRIHSNLGIICQGFQSVYDGHGLMKPLPCLLWCAFSLTSDGCADTVTGEETTAERIAPVILEVRGTEEWNAFGC